MNSDSITCGIETKCVNCVEVFENPYINAPARRIASLLEAVSMGCLE